MTTKRAVRLSRSGDAAALPIAPVGAVTAVEAGLMTAPATRLARRRGGCAVSLVGPPPSGA